MISIKQVFKIKKNLILTTNDIHNYKVGDIVYDQRNKQYKIIGIVFQTNDLFVEPLFDYNNENIERIN